MGEESWHQARLIPTSGISGSDEQERRATSALLAVLRAVREFGRAVTQPLGAPAGAVEAFIEVPFAHGDGKVFPDGLIRVRRGQKVWTALVEVKTGSNRLAAPQLEQYLDVAREQGFDALLTISNEIPAVAGQHPVVVDKRKLRTVALHHLAWSQILTEAVVQKEHRGVADPDQAWILGELIRYLEHDRSGALEFDDMGASWVPVRDAVAAGTLRPADRGVGDVVARFDGLLRYAGLSLGRRLGTDVVPLLSKKELADPSGRGASLAGSLVSSGVLSGGLRIPSLVGPLVITADLRAGRVTAQVDLNAPREGRATTRVNWLVRQLRTAPDATRIEAFTLGARGLGTAELLRSVREDAALLIADPKKELRSFRVALDQPMGAKRGRGKGSFIDSVLELIDLFYADVAGALKAWSAPTVISPVLRAAEPEPLEPVAERLISTAISSQDGPETGAIPVIRRAAPAKPAPRPAAAPVDGVDAAPVSGVEAAPTNGRRAATATIAATEAEAAARVTAAPANGRRVAAPAAETEPAAPEPAAPEPAAPEPAAPGAAPVGAGVSPSPLLVLRVLDEEPRHPSRRELRLARALDPAAAEAGWYQDPRGVAQLRWWDGEAWTDRTYVGGRG